MNKKRCVLYLITIFILSFILMACTAFGDDLGEEEMNIGSNIKVIDFSTNTLINNKPLEKGAGIPYESELLALDNAWIDYEYLTYDDNGNDRIRLSNGKLLLSPGCYEDDTPDIGGLSKSFKKEKDGCLSTNTSTLYLTQGDIYVSLHEQDKPTLNSYEFTTDDVVLSADFGSQFMLIKKENYSAIYVCNGTISISKRGEYDFKKLTSGMELVINSKSEAGIKANELGEKAVKGFEAMDLSCKEVN